jgi:hypothetical protein
VDHDFDTALHLGSAVTRRSLDWRGATNLRSRAGLA